MTPYDVVAQTEPSRRVAKPELIRLSRDLERAALDDPPPSVFATLQDARFLTDRTRSSYARLAERGAAVQLHARGMQAWIAPGVRGVDIDDEDPLVDQWCLLLPSATQPAALTATDLHEPAGADSERTFLLAISRDPQVVEACVRALG